MATGALAYIGDAAVPALAKLLKSEDWQVRANVVKALEHIKTPEAQKALEAYRNP
jgi:HEAT repeat protein